MYSVVLPFADFIFFVECHVLFCDIHMYIVIYYVLMWNLLKYKGIKMVSTYFHRPSH